MADYLSYYVDDTATSVGLAYVEGIEDGRAFHDTIHEVARRMPLVLVKGGATAGGARAAASHTGSLSSDDRTFEGVCRQAGATRAATVEQAFEAAATFATQPLPRGKGTLLALGDDPVVDVQRVALPPGSTLVVYTDGVREATAPDGALFGEAGIHAAVAEAYAASAQALAETLLRQVAQHRGPTTPQQDDITVVVVKL